MTTSPGFRGTMVSMALVVLSAVASIPITHASPPPESATASGGVVPQPADCSDAWKENERCVPRGSGTPTRPGEPVLPPGPPITLPVGPPAEPPEDLHSPQFIFGRAQATLHLTDDDQDVTYVSGFVQLLFIKRHVQDMPGNTQYVLFTASGPVNQPSLSMTWTATGQEFGCTIEGQAIITFPIELDPNIPRW